jgi:tRNA threonylcarbamoyladenosine biosynthesis protein TsaB
VNVLAFDTSTPSTAVGLLLEDGRLLEAYDHVRARGRPGHQARLLPLAAELLARGGVGWERLDRIAVGLGPGTFTGLRVGVASARALAQSLSVELVGISSSLALAHAARSEQPLAARGGVLTIVDARRGEVFLAAYRARAQAAAPSVLRPPEPVAPEDVSRAFDELVAAEQPPERGPWLAVGDGAPPLRGALTAAGAQVAPDASSLHQVSGRALCELAADARAQMFETVVPDYCRRADAELAMEARERNGRPAAGRGRADAEGASPAPARARLAGSAAR